jgi:hypothetical protein
MSRARALIEAMTPMPESIGGSSTTVAPPKPGKTGTTTKPVAPQPGKGNPSPFRRKDIRPQDEPRPKAAMSAPPTSYPAMTTEAAFRSGTSAKLGSKAKKLITGKSGKSQSSLSPKKTF